MENGIHKDIKLLEDSQISETDRTIVDSYTTLENANKLYDFAKSYLVYNYKGETNFLVQRNGNNITTTKKHSHR